MLQFAFFLSPLCVFHFFVWRLTCHLSMYLAFKMILSKSARNPANRLQELESVIEPKIVWSRKLLLSCVFITFFVLSYYIWGENFNTKFLSYNKYNIELITTCTCLLLLLMRWICNFKFGSIAPTCFTSLCSPQSPFTCSSG